MTADKVAFSVDLEPNKDGTLDGIRDAMEWFDETVPCGTVFATYRIATEMPELLAELATSHEIGVHVHPREFGHDRDQLAELSSETQRELIKTTRTAVTDAVGIEPVSFRAGRHSASCETLRVLGDLGFDVDASINVRYDEYFSSELIQRFEPFEIDGLIEVPITYGTLPILSRCGLRALAERPVTATAATLRADRWVCSGLRVVAMLMTQVKVVSFYMHPYDATDYHDIENGGEEYRDRFEGLISMLDPSTFSTVGSL